MSGKPGRSGRLSTYKQEIADEICEKIASGMTLRGVSRCEGMPPESTIRLWVLDNEDFAAQYSKARDMQFETWADQIIEIADDVSGDNVLRDGETIVNNTAVNRARLMFDARRWLLSRLKPQMYGERVEVKQDNIMRIVKEDPKVIELAKEDWAEKYSGGLPTIAH